MKMFLKSVLLACLLSLFVFDNLVMGQPWRNRNATAQSRNIYYKGVKLGVDTPLKVLEEAMKEGFSDGYSDATVSHAAQFYLAQCQLLGYNGVPKDEKKAGEEFRMLFDCINIGGANIGRWTGLYAVPVGRNQRAFPPSVNGSFSDSMAEYIDRIRKNAEQGDADAQIKLGIYYTLAMGVPSNPRESVKWIRQAAEQGNAEAQGILASFYAEGYGGLSVSQAEYVKWIRLAAAQGDFGAQHMVEAMKWQTAPPQRGSTQRQSQPGVRIARVYPNTTASSLRNSAGLRIEANDYLCSINGQEIRSDAEFKRIVASLPRNSDVTVEILDHRTKKMMTFSGTMDVSSQLRFGMSLIER